MGRNGKVESDSDRELVRAVEAWRELAGGDRAIEAEPISGGRHSTAVQLRTGDPAAPSVVAKLRPSGGLDLERLIHESILPTLGVDTPAFLGFAYGHGGESDVLFLEHVGMTEFRPSEPSHQQAAGRWLGSCHATSARVSISPLVPRRGPSEERVELTRTRSQLSETLENPALHAAGRSLVSRVLDLLDDCTDRWADWSQRVAAVPPVLTHGAFITRNVRMRGAGARLTTLPFDWDHVAVRSPAIDLACASGGFRGFAANAALAPYRDALVANGLPLEPDVVATLSTWGTVIRAVACIGWLVGSLASEHLEYPLAELDLYRRALAEALGRR